MKEIGLELPKRKMAEFQKKMNEMAKANFKALMEKSEAKMSKAEIMTLRKMGLSPEFISNMDPDVNPFNDKGLGDKADFLEVAEKSKIFYEELKETFRKQEGQMSVSVDEDAIHMTAEEKQAALSVLEQPKDFADWTKKK